MTDALYAFRLEMGDHQPITTFDIRSSPVLFFKIFEQYFNSMPLKSVVSIDRKWKKYETSESSKSWHYGCSSEMVSELHAQTFLDNGSPRIRSSPEMGSSDRLFNRQRTVHAVLGGGLVADVILWRRKKLTWGILIVTLAAWVVFEMSGYTLLSLSSSVLLLLTTILFLWAKSAAILNRPSPPLPEMHISEDMMNNAAAVARTHINALLLAFQDVALGKDTWMFLKVALSLLLISVVGSLTDFLTLGYTSLVVILTVPALYEKYEEHFDKHIMAGYGSAVQFYSKLSEGCISKVQQWIAEQKKLS